MRPIKSIIVFNSATAGDFLTALCWSQLTIRTDTYNQKTSGRMQIRNGYFKDITQESFYNPQKNIEFDYSQTFPVENSHYWLDRYCYMADRCVYINYPAEAQQGIVQIYVEKVFDNDVQKMLDLNIANQNSYIASKMTIDNVIPILNVQWLKNIKAWKQNNQLTAVELEDFFIKSKMENIVEMLIGQEISDQKKFDEVYGNWIDNNSKLKSLFF
jgi:hypothetical protein